MHLLRWTLLTYPIFRSIVLFGFFGMLLTLNWLPTESVEFGAFLALGFIQGTLASFLAAASILLLSVPFYFFKSSQTQVTVSRATLIEDHKFVAKLLWPHRILSLLILVGSFITFTNLYRLEFQLIFGLSLLNFFFYISKADSVSQGLNFLRFIESGIILIVSMGLGFVVYGFYILFLLSNDSQMPTQESAKNFILIFCAAAQALYQEYLSRKLSQVESVVRSGK